MSIAQQILGKPLAELKLEDIQNFFKDPQNETDILEFKSHPAGGDLQKSLNNVVAVVGSFLNSAGGLVIWGAPKFNKETKNFVGELSPVEFNYEKDTLVRIVSSRITPIPLGIQTHQIPIPDTNPQSFVYLIEVAQSPYSPHQVDGKDYFMRLDGQKHHAPHHYLEALFNKKSFPNLVCQLKDIERGDYRQGQNVYQYTYELEISNQSRLLNEENLFFSISISEGQLKTSSIVGSTWTKLEPQMAIFPQIQPLLFYGAPFVGKFTVIIEFPHMNKEIFITIRVGGKNAPLREFVYSCFVTFSQGKTYAHSLKKISTNLVGDL